MGKEIKKPPVDFIRVLGKDFNPLSIFIEDWNPSPLSHALLSMVVNLDKTEEGHPPEASVAEYLSAKSPMYKFLHQEHRDPVLRERQAMAVLAIALGWKLANHFLHESKHNGSGGEFGYAHHAFRTAEELIMTMKIQDPYLILLCFIHDFSNETIHGKKFRQFLEDELELMKTQYSDSPLHQKFITLVRKATQRQDMSLRGTKLRNDWQVLNDAKVTLDKQIDVAMRSLSVKDTGGSILERLKKGAFTFNDFYSLLSSLSGVFSLAVDFLSGIRTGTTEGWGMDKNLLDVVGLLEMVDPDDDETEWDINVVLVLIAQALDRHRYPKGQTEEERQESRLRYALINQLALIALAHFLDLKEAVKLMGQNNCEVIYPKQTAALNQGLAVFEQQMGATLAEMQAEYMEWVEGLVEEYIAELDLPYQPHFVSPEEFEARKAMYLVGQWPEELLAPYEYTIFGQEKTAPSILAKLVKQANQDRFNDYDEPVDELSQTVDFWVDHLQHRQHDLVRGTVVFGEGLAKHFVQKDEQNSIIARLKRDFPMSGTKAAENAEQVNYALSDRPFFEEVQKIYPMLSNLELQRRALHRREEEIYEEKDWGARHCLVQLSKDRPINETQYMSIATYMALNLGSKKVNANIHAFFKTFPHPENVSQEQKDHVTHVYRLLLSLLMILRYDGALPIPFSAFVAGFNF